MLQSVLLQKHKEFLNNPIEMLTPYVSVLNKAISKAPQVLDSMSFLPTGFYDVPGLLPFSSKTLTIKSPNVLLEPKPVVVAGPPLQKQPTSVQTTKPVVVQTPAAQPIPSVAQPQPIPPLAPPAPKTRYVEDSVMPIIPSSQMYKLLEEKMKYYKYKTCCLEDPQHVAIYYKGQTDKDNNDDIDSIFNAIKKIPETDLDAYLNNLVNDPAKPNRHDIRLLRVREIYDKHTQTATISEGSITQKKNIYARRVYQEE